MIRLLKITLLSIVSLLIAVSSLNAESFEDFVKDRERDTVVFKENYDTHISTMDKEFNEYKRIVNDEFKKYTKTLSKYWGKPVLSTPKKWVEYSKDKKSRKTVDFEKGEIEVSVILPKNDRNYSKKLNNLLSDLLTEDTKTAFKRDPVAVNVEKRIKRKLTSVVSAPVKRKPIVTDIFFARPKPSRAKVKKRVRQIRKHTVVKRKPSKVKNSTVYSIKLRIPNAFKRKAKAYVPIVKKTARKWNIDPALIMAIIQTESGFNPMAKNYIPAYGLMQIVPRSAGLDTSRVLFGRRKMLSSSYLFNGKNNINVGTCYVNILMYKYLKKIKNKESRLYCAIAAYNTGSGNIAKAFIGNFNINKAVHKINRYTPRQVYNRLIRHLTHREAINYLKNVSRRMNYYKGI